jgi:hypothetical protein
LLGNSTCFILGRNWGLQQRMLSWEVDAIRQALCLYDASQIERTYSLKRSLLSLCSSQQLLSPLKNWEFIKNLERGLFFLPKENISKL